MKSQRLKKCKSMEDVARRIMPSSTVRKKSNTSKKQYMGRRSLGIHMSTSTGGKRKKSKTEIDRDIYDDLYDNNIDEGYDEDNCYKCIPSIGREDNELSGSTEGVAKNELADATTLSLSFKRMEIHRNALNQRIVQFFEKEKKVTQTIVDCRIEGKCRNLTIVGNNNTFKYGNILWLVLRAQQSANANSDAKHMIVGRQEWLSEDQNIRNTRHKYSNVLERILNFRFDSTARPCSSATKMVFDEEYCRELRDAKQQVESVLNDFDALAELFPNSAVLSKWVAETRNVKDKMCLDVRLANLRVWLNTVLDFESTIESLGTLFDTDDKTDWFKPFDETNRVFSLEAIQEVFQSYVEKTIDLKEMKKVLSRIDNLTSVTIAKSAILLQKSPTSYAAATKINDVEIPIDDVMKKRYGEMAEYKFSDKKASCLNLPNLSSLFYFVLTVPMQLVVCWLDIRTNSKLPEHTFLDELTFDAMITDTKECLDEAIRINRQYFGMLNSIGPIPIYMYPVDYENRVHVVFKKYMQYVKSWASCQTVQANPVHLFTKLEEEWVTGLRFARSTRSGMELLSCACFDILNTLVREFVETYTDDKIDEYKSELFNESDSDENEAIEVSDKLHNNFRHAINVLIKEVKERELRIFSFLRYVLNDIYDSVAYSINDVIEKKDEFFEAIKDDYYMIKLETDFDNEPMPIAMFVNNSIVSNSSTLEKCLADISNGQRINEGSVIVVPDKSDSFKTGWTHRTTQFQIDEFASLYLSHFLRHDVVLRFGGNYEKQILESLKIECIAPICYSNDIVSSNIRDLCENRLLKHLERQSEKIAQLLDKCASYGHHIHFKLEQHFLIAFQIHRDVSKVISDTFMKNFGQDMVQKAINLVQYYLEYVNIRKTTPSKNFPMWASPVFLFLQYFTEPRWVAENVMSLQQYKIIEKLVNDLEAKIMQKGETDHIQMSYTRMTRSTSSKYSNVSSNESKRETQMEKIARIENKRDSLNWKNGQIGKVLGDDDRNVHEIIGSNEHVIRAPFTWTTLQEIGSGTYGTVFQAFDIDNHRSMAAKRIPIRKGHDTSDIQREINIFRTLQHENLVQYYGYEVRPTEVFIFMELCSSDTLKTICHGNMNLDLVRKLTHSLLKAVRYLHFSKNVIHRDIKPDNIFLDNKTVLKLGDFGCSAQLQNEATVYGEFTRTVGTAQYMAPEVYSFGSDDGAGNYEGYGRSIDIWAVGCTVIEMMTGSPPWKGMELMTIAWELCQKKTLPTYPAIAQERQDVKKFLDLCFRFDPKERADATKLLITTFANVNVDNMQELADSTVNYETPRISREESTNSFQFL